MGVAVDLVKAASWYEKAAAQGHPSAQSRLGYLYKSGIKGKPDFKKAYQWLSKAAETGDAYSQANLAQLYENGLGVKKNNQKAYHWYFAAANQNHVQSQKRLASIYETGKGIKADLLHAYMWYSIAGVWESVGEELAPDDPRVALQKRMSQADIQKAEVMATDWWIKHFAKNNPSTP